MQSIIFSHDTALAIWSSSTSRATESKMTMRSANTALRRTGNAIRKSNIACIRKLPWSNRIPHDLDLLVVGDENRRMLKNVRCYKQAHELSPGSLVPLGQPILNVETSEELQLYATSPELTFLHMSSVLEFPELVELGFELCGTYAVAPGTKHGIIERKPVTSVSKLRRFLDGAGGMYGVKRARRATSIVLDGSRSPRETVLVQFSITPRRLSGLGIHRPVMNKRVSAPREYSFVLGASSYIPDVFWEETKTVLEYDSRMWHSAEERLEHDARKRNLYRLLGFECITMTNGQLRDFNSFACIMENLDADIRRAKGLRTRPPTSEELRRRQRELHAFLLYGERRRRFAAHLDA